MSDKERLCTACHASDGRVGPVHAPVLAGQSKDYLVAQLQTFRDHTRANGDGRFYMWPMAAGLSDAMVDHLAGYFAALPPPAAQAAAAGTAAGQSLFSAGAPERGIAACSSCHGAQGQGVAVFPRLAGQHRDYLAAQLHAFADGSRPNPIMGPMAKNLSAAEVQSVADYLASL